MYMTNWQPPHIRQRNGRAYRIFEALKEGLPPEDGPHVEIVWGRYVVLARDGTVQLARLDRSQNPEAWLFDWELIAQTWSTAVRDKCRALTSEVLAARTPPPS